MCVWTMSLPVTMSPGLTLSTSSAASEDPNGDGVSGVRSAMPVIPRIGQHTSSGESGKDITSPEQSADGSGTKYHAIFTGSSDSEPAKGEIAISIAGSQSSHGAKTVIYDDQFAAHDEIQEDSGQRYAHQVSSDGGSIDIETAPRKTVPTMSKDAINSSGEASSATMSLGADEVQFHDIPPTPSSDVAAAAAAACARGSDVQARAQHYVLDPVSHQFMKVDTQAGTNTPRDSSYGTASAGTHTPKAKAGDRAADKPTAAPMAKAGDHTADKPMARTDGPTIGKPMVWTDGPTIGARAYLPVRSGPRSGSVKRRSDDAEPMAASRRRMFGGSRDPGRQASASSADVEARIRADMQERDATIAMQLQQFQRQMQQQMQDTLGQLNAEQQKAANRGEELHDMRARSEQLQEQLHHVHSSADSRIREVEAEAEKRYAHGTAKIKSEAEEQYRAAMHSLQQQQQQQQLQQQQRQQQQQRDHTALCAQCLIKDSRIAELTQQLGNAQATINGHQQEHNKMQAEMHSMSVASRALGEKLTESEQTNNKLVKQCADAEANNDAMRQQHTVREEQLSGHAENLSAELESLKLQLAEAKSSHAGNPELHEQNIRLRIEAEKAKAQVELMTKLLTTGAVGQQRPHMPGQAMPNAKHSTRSARSQTSHGDRTIDDGDENDHEDGDYKDFWGAPGYATYTATATATQPTFTFAASAPTGGGDDGSAGGSQRPPRMPSGGGGGGGGGGSGGGGPPHGSGGGGGSASNGGSANGEDNNPNPQRRTPGSGGSPHGSGGGGGGGGDDDPGRTGSDRAPRRRRHDSDSDAPCAMRTIKEGDEIKIPSLPKSAAEYRPWMDAVVDAVTACAKDVDSAFEWIVRVEAESCKFDELYDSSEFKSLDAKLRSGISKHINGTETGRNAELVSSLQRRRDELRKDNVPRQIRGRQLLYAVRQFYGIRPNEHISFELSALMDLEYPGDAKLPEFKDRWDHMIRHLRTKLSKEDLESILVRKLRASDLLKPQLDYYDRIPRGHADKCYDWVCQLIDTMVEDARFKRNAESLVIQASGKEQKPRPAKPAKPTDGGGKGGKGGKDGNAETPPKDPKGKGKGDKDKGKGKGKGKDKTSSGSESDGSKKRTDGKTTKEIPPDQMCCIKNLWGKCERNPSPHAHRDAPTKGIVEHNFYKTCVDKWGPPKAGNNVAGAGNA